MSSQHALHEPSCTKAGGVRHVTCLTAAFSGNLTGFYCSQWIRAQINSKKGGDHDVVLGIGFLTSYEHMGMAYLECRSGCKCKRKTLQGMIDVKASQTDWCAKIGSAPQPLCCRRPAKLKQLWGNRGDASRDNIGSAQREAGQNKGHRVFRILQPAAAWRRVFHAVSQHEECILQVSIANQTLSDAHKFKVRSPGFKPTRTSFVTR